MAVTEKQKIKHVGENVEKLEPFPLLVRLKYICSVENILRVPEKATKNYHVIQQFHFWNTVLSLQHYSL
jgi:hypothetical protein